MKSAILISTIVLFTMCKGPAENKTISTAAADSIAIQPSKIQKKLVGTWRCDSIVKPELTYTAGPLLIWMGHRRHIEFNADGGFIVYYSAGNDSLIKQQYRLLGDTAIQTGEKEWIDKRPTGNNTLTKKIVALDNSKMVLSEKARILGNQIIRGASPNPSNPSYTVYYYYTKVQGNPTE